MRRHVTRTSRQVFRRAGFSGVLAKPFGEVSVKLRARVFRFAFLLRRVT
jgi:hypothetical protein